MPKVMVLGSESSIGSLRNVEELEQGSVKWRQIGGGTVAYAGELERHQRDRPQGFEKVVAGGPSRDVTGEQVGDLGEWTERPSGGPFEQAEDHEGDAQDGDQADDALIAGDEKGADPQGALGAPMAVLDLPLALPLREQGTRGGFLRRAGRLEHVVAVEGLDACEGLGAQLAAHRWVPVDLVAAHLIQGGQMPLLEDGLDFGPRPLGGWIPAAADPTDDLGDLGLGTLPLAGTIAAAGRLLLAAEHEQPLEPLASFAAVSVGDGDDQLAGRAVVGGPVLRWLPRLPHTHVVQGQHLLRWDRHDGRIEVRRPR